MTGEDLLKWFHENYTTITSAADDVGCARSTVRYWLHPLHRKTRIPEWIRKRVKSLAAKEEAD